MTVVWSSPFKKVDFDAPARVSRLDAQMVPSQLPHTPCSVPISACDAAVGVAASFVLTCRALLAGGVPTVVAESLDAVADGGGTHYIRGWKRSSHFL